MEVWKGGGSVGTTLLMCMYYLRERSVGVVWIRPGIQVMKEAESSWEEDLQESHEAAIPWSVYI